MRRIPFRLVARHLIAHWFRSGLTAVGMAVAIFLFCVLVSIVTSMQRVVSESAANRLIVQSAVSLFVELPLDYQSKIAALEGVEIISKFQWFGGFYKEQGNFFAQFGVDHDRFLGQYARDLEVTRGPAGASGPPAEAVQQALAADRRAILVGEGLLKRFGWKIGDTVPIIGTIFQKQGGSAWEFNIVGAYRPLKSNMDDQTLFFRYDYLEETLRQGGATGPLGVGTYAINVARGYDPAQVIAAIDRMFENGPQKTKTTTEAAFQAQFLSMMGNLPMFIGTIGGAVVAAVLFLLVNTMLMSARQRVHETGILKAVGFSDAALAAIMFTESMGLASVGAASGVGLAVVAEGGLREAMRAMIPGFAVESSTALLGIGIALAIGFLGGIVPALQAARLQPTEALRSEG